MRSYNKSDNVKIGNVEQIFLVKFQIEQLLANGYIRSWTCRTFLNNDLTVLHYN